jgi:nitronate monooxygenase
VGNPLAPLYLGDLEVKIPIIQGGMGVLVSTATLAAAVANCGAAGTIASVGLGYGRPENDSDYPRASREGLQEQIRAARALSPHGVIGTNILSAISNYEELARTAVAEGIDFIVSGAGLPLKLPEYAEGSSTKLIAIVSSGRAADLIIRTWKKRYDRLPDALVVEGPMAGGHLGFRSEEVQADGDPSQRLQTIVREVVAVTESHHVRGERPMPVVAAGGVFDGWDMAAMLQQGASAVQLGTRFVATHECSVADEFKQLYLTATEEDLVIIPSPVGMPGRAIRTSFVDRVLSGERVPFRCNYHCLVPCKPQRAPYCIAQALFNAASGNLDEAVVFAGSNVARVDKIVSVAELIEEIVQEASASLNEQTARAE